MLRSGRERRIRLVLAVGCLTAVATSAAEPFRRTDEATLDVEPDASARLTVRANDSAHLAAEEFEIEFGVPARFGVEATLRIVPDDARLPTHELRLSQDRITCITCADTSVTSADDDDEQDGGEQAGTGSDDDAGGVAGAAPVRMDHARVQYDVAHERCPARGDCEIGFTLERLDEPARYRGPLPVEIHAEVRRSADPQFLCPDNRDFRSGSTVEIEIDD